MADLVKIKILSDEDRVTVAQFPASGVPDEADYALITDEILKETVLKASEQSLGQKYMGRALPSEYYVGIRRGGVLEVHPMSMYRMHPIVAPPELTGAQLLDSQKPLTFKEQMEEMKEKFGSRKTQRQLSSKRKYAIEFGEEDVEHIDIKTQKVAESTLEQKSAQTSLNDSLEILPHQNRDAICVEEVYDMNEIITENERSILMPLVDQLFDQIDDQFIKGLMYKLDDKEQKIIAVYIQLIVKLLNLKAQHLKKPDPLPEVLSEVKEFLFSRYLNTKVVQSNRIQYSFSAKQKDRLIIYGLILSIMLHNYRPIDFDMLQKSFKTPARQFRKVVEIVGCYIETTKNATGVNVKSIVFKVPLNTFTESRKSFRRR